MKILITGAAGFIGSTLGLQELSSGTEVIGIDNLNHYYDVALKNARLDRLKQYQQFSFVEGDVADKTLMAELFAHHKPTHVMHLAAQAGVRYSIEDPWAYLHSNLVGFLSMLEAVRANPVEHFVFASTSSVYGANTNHPYSEHSHTDHPISFYAATKKSNEVMAHTYAHLFGIPMTGVRFFTVYGPWGRPDMALFKFTKNILAGEPIDIFNFGKMQRDFTYIDDIVAGIQSLMPKPPKPDTHWDGGAPDPATSGVAPFRILNIGNSKSEQLMRYIDVLEDCMGKKAIKNMLPGPKGEVLGTWADVSELHKLTNYQPKTNIETGVRNFVEWYKAFYTPVS